MSTESTGRGEPDRTLRLLWRHRLGDPVGSRGPKQRSSVDEVVDAAIEIADEEVLPENLDSIANITRFVGAKVGGGSNGAG